MAHTSRKKRLIAKGLAAGLSASVVVALASHQAHALPAPEEGVSNAMAQALNLDLADQELPADVLVPAIAANGGEDVVTSVVPLDLGPLEDLGLGVGPADLLGEDGVLALAALNQVASAAPDGSSLAAAGAVSDEGLIDIPADPVSTDSGASLTIGTETIGAGDLLELSIDIGAIASSAELASGGEPSGAWDVSNLSAGLGGSLIGDIATQITDAVAPVADQLTTLGSLVGADGIAIENPLEEGSLEVSEDHLLQAAGVESLNELPAGTDVVEHLPDAIVAALTGVVDDLIAQVQGAVEQLKSAPGLATICSPPLLPPNPACDVIDTAVGTVTDSLNGVLDGVVETALATIADTLSQLIALPVGTETLSDDGAFALTALSAILGPDGSLGSLDLATSSVGPNG